MGSEKIDHLIINSAFEEPKYHWEYDLSSGLFEKAEGRRKAGYVIATPGSQSFNDPGIFIPIELVEKIRPRVKKWRNNNYPGTSGTTQRLLKHWNDPEQRLEGRRLFFCQLEAIETLIWLKEAPEADKVGIQIPSDGGAFERICTKMATGTGKTVVMAMLITWIGLNKVVDNQNVKYSKNFLIIAPGLTIKERLQILEPSNVGNYYDQFNLVPAGLREKLNQVKILVHNWHSLNWESEERLAKKHCVDKRGPKSDEAYTREVLGKLAKAQNLIVINDEAHHAWRISPEINANKEEKEEATIWIGGLDRIQKTRTIMHCYDFSATPFVSTGKKGSEEALYKWVASDFGLNDSIESGLVKTPQVVIRDDGRLSKDYKSRFYHLYNDDDVKDDLSRRAEEHEPLPDLVSTAYALLGKDWEETEKMWGRSGLKTPPVMITVANRTETAARIKFAFDHKKIMAEKLCDPTRTLHIDSKVLEKAEKEIENLNSFSSSDNEDEEAIDISSMSKKEQETYLRKRVSTVGKLGQPGEQLQNIISVGMLSEGWDARTVTHIMGLRAFTSQLLCEQVVGRGLRRTEYEPNEETGFFEPEYVNIFGVPFTFLPHEDPGDALPKITNPKFPVEPDPSKQMYEITWPNILRIEHVFRPHLMIDMERVKPLVIDAYNTPTIAELAPVIQGKPDITRITDIDMEELGRKYRTQKIIFETARDIYDQMAPNWRGNKEILLAQLIKIVEKFIQAGKIQVLPPLFYQDDLRRRIVITLNMGKLVQYIWDAVRYDSTEKLEPVFDRDYPIRSTGTAPVWYTSKPSEITKKSHINRCVFDSTWEASEMFELERNENVDAWAKNDHLGFEILYTYQGIVRKYYPDFIIKLSNGQYLILETKGKEKYQDAAKRVALEEWVKAINEHGGFGVWDCAMSKNPADMRELIKKYNK
jgi:type III restriction enzyme